MSILSNCEIKCSCGETFEAELWKAINVFDDPDLKEVLLSGRFNTVECPKCHKVFYHEHFFMYQDLQNELIAYVYPKEDEKSAKNLRKKMLSDFASLSKDIEELAEIDFEPVIYFGVEDLIKIKPSKARNLCILHTIPKSKKSSGDIKKDIISGLEQLLKYNPNLVEYENFLARIKQNISCLDEILLHKKEK